MTSYRLNNFDTMGRTIAKKVDTKQSAKTVIERIIKLFRKIAEHHLKESGYKDLIMYKELYKQANSLIIWVEKECPKCKYIDEFKKIIEDLDNIETVDDMLNDLDNYYDALLNDL